jgi:glucose/arabinose dehydrogenase
MRAVTFAAVVILSQAIAAQATQTPAPQAPAPQAPAPQAPEAPEATEAPELSEAPEKAASRMPLIAMGAVILLLLAVVGWLFTRNTGGVREGEGELAVQSRPAGARVVVDGKEHGVTPITVRLPAGAHVLEVQVGKAEPRVIPLTITAGVQTSQYIELRDVVATGSLSIRSEPTGARITINGQPRGTTPATIPNLSAGDHTVVLELGGRKATQSVRIEAGGTAQLMVPMPRR